MEEHFRFFFPDYRKKKNNNDNNVCMAKADIFQLVPADVTTGVLYSKNPIFPLTRQRPLKT